MNRQTFAWDSSRNKLRQEERWLDFFCLVGLFLAALVVFGINLGNLPLRDWDEGTVARVAKEIWLSGANTLSWLFPTLWGKPYLNKPPLVHNLIAFSYSLAGVNEWTARLPGAFLTACSVPLLYRLGREIFPIRLPALFSALIYLTLLPVVRHGRLAMLDGAVLCFGMVMLLSVLRSRRDLRWSLGVGLGFALIGLTKGMMALLLGTIALIFIAWDTPRLLTSVYFWLGVLLGSTPAIAWYAAQWIHYGNEFSKAIVEQFWRRIPESVDSHRGPVWYYLLEILKSALPWLLFSLYGLRQAWDNRNWSWAKVILVWSSVYFVAVSLMGTKLPWYILPIYPALALAGGAALAEVQSWPSDRAYPRVWIIVLGVLATSAGIAAFCVTFGFTFGLFESIDYFLILIFAAIALTMGVTAILIGQREQQFIPVLFWGMYLSLILLMISPHWIWELNEDNPTYPAKEIGAMIRLHTPSQQVVYTSFDYERPSLNFYSERRVLPPPSAAVAHFKQALRGLSAQQIEALISASELAKLRQELNKLQPDLKEFTFGTLETLQENLAQLTPQQLAQLQQKLARILKELTKRYWMEQYWQSASKPYLLVDDRTFKQIHLELAQIQGVTPAQETKWLLITKEQN